MTWQFGRCAFVTFSGEETIQSGYFPRKLPGGVGSSFGKRTNVCGKRRTEWRVGGFALFILLEELTREAGKKTPFANMANEVAFYRTRPFLPRRRRPPRLKKNDFRRKRKSSGMSGESPGLLPPTDLTIESDLTM